MNNKQTTHAGQVYDRDFIINYTSYERNDLMVDSPDYMLQKHVYTAWGERLEQYTERGNWDRLLYVHEDVMGNTMYYTKATGQTFSELRYDVWGFPDLSGKLQNNDNGNFVAANFTGHTYDTVLDIYFAEARFYDAANRQWMASDPIKSGLNWYSYVNDNPTTFFDPNGLYGVQDSNPSTVLGQGDTGLGYAAASTAPVGSDTLKETLDTLARAAEVLGNPENQTEVQLGMLASIVDNVGSQAQMSLTAVSQLADMLLTTDNAKEIWSQMQEGKDNTLEWLESKAESKEAFYAGKSLGDVATIAFGLYGTVKGVSQIIAIVGTEGGAILGSGGIAVVAVGATVELVTLSAVEAGAGIALAGTGYENFNNDWEKFNHFSKIECENNVDWSNENNKHIASKNMSWKDIVKDTKGKAAKYKPGLDVEDLERNVWKNGKPSTNGKDWKVMEFDDVIGASDGKETRFVRVERTNVTDTNPGTIHGHPITVEEFRKLTK